MYATYRMLLPIKISASWATRSIFFIAGLATATWAAIIPTVKANTMVNDATLGLLLLCMGVGALVAMPLAGRLTTLFGCRKVLLFSVAFFTSLLPIILFVSSTSWIALLLVLFGIGIGFTDCAINIQGIIVEKKAKRPLMSGFHGFYSLGAIIGASIITLLMSLGVSAFFACAICSLLMLLLLFVSVSGLLSYANPQQTTPFSLPRGPVLLIGLVCFVLFLAEGTVFDWSGVFLTEYRDIAFSRAGIGIVCFSVTMTIARLMGDRAIAHLGARKVVTWGGIIATSGFILSLSTAVWPLPLLGYALIGLGCANIVPIMFSATGRQNVMPQVTAVPAVATLGYFGILAGPAGVGFVAQLFTLPVALYGIAVLIALATLIAQKIEM